MRWAVTGTPGTGKTTATRHLDVGFPILHINELIEEGCFQAGYDEGRGSTIADIDQLRSWLRKQPREIVVEIVGGTLDVSGEVATLRDIETQIRRQADRAERI